MGIPYLFRHLALAYPFALRVVPPNQPLPGCDLLCVDFNGLAHESARDLPPHARDDHSVAAASVERLDRLVARLRPKRSLLVAVDGVPPRAKMSQQRSRRYMAAWRKATFPDPAAAATTWDTNAITPGTAFMEVLADALHAWAAGHTACEVVVSDASVKGEGEQKIFASISSSASSAAPSIYVYGLDADLILMALRSPARDRLHVVREQADALQLIDVKKLAVGVAKDMAQPALDGDSGDLTAARLRDFAALCALLGNDFVPSLPGLRIRDGAVRLLVGAYKRAREATAARGSRLASDAGPDALGGLDVRLLATVLREVAAREGELLAAVDKRYHDRVRWAASAPAALLADPEEVYPALHPPAFGPDAVRPGEGSAWRLRYYHHLFGASNAASVRAACLQYLCGLAWTLCYLGDQRCLSEGWCYPHGHAPTAHDMCNLLLDDGLAREAEAVMEATHRRHAAAASKGGPQWPLLMVLPPASAGLVRDARLRAYMTSNPDSAHAFPLGFRLDTYLKDRLWECHPVLPPLGGF
jgi:5'-3' exonuclease